MDKWLFCLKGTVADIFRGNVKGLHHIPKCWVFYGFKYEFLQTLNKTIDSLGSGRFTQGQKEEAVKNLESTLQDFENYMAKNEKKKVF